MGLLDPLFGSDAVNRIFSDRARLQAMLDFEAALARAEGRAGVIPPSAANGIVPQCRAEKFDCEVLAAAAVSAGNLAIPMVKQLTALVKQQDPEAARYIHWGATSQDAIDTGLMLQVREALQALDSDLSRLRSLLEDLADRYRSTPLPARTWLQQAVPTVFGLKAAGWLDALTRHQGRLRELRSRALVLQFGGAAGTLASLGSYGLDVSKALSEDLGLLLPDLPWHAHRDRIVEIGAVLALCVGTLGKMARDIALQMQTEVGEVLEPSGEGRGGSSTMPHKRNPVCSVVVLAAAARVPALVSTLLVAMPQEHERGLGGWHAEWESLPEIFRLSAGALHQMITTVEGLEIHANRMCENLDRTQGLIFAENAMIALAHFVGRPEAHKLVEAASHRALAEGKHLRDMLASDPAVTAHLSRNQIDQLFDPMGYLGVAEQFIDRAIRTSRTVSMSQNPQNR